MFGVCDRAPVQVIWYLREEKSRDVDTPRDGVEGSCIWRPADRFFL